MIREEVQTHLISSGIRNEKRSVFLKNTAFPLVEKQASFFRKKIVLITSLLLTTLVQFIQFVFFVIRQVLWENLSSNFSNISRHHN
jgi:hypothetical protein